MTENFEPKQVWDIGPPDQPRGVMLAFIQAVYDDSIRVRYIGAAKDLREELGLESTEEIPMGVVQKLVGEGRWKFDHTIETWYW